MPDRLTNHLLGYPQDARLLIINADDFGLCNATNAAIMGVLGAGTVRSTTLMVPCPWAPQAIHFLSQHPEQPFGIHLTAMSDPQAYRWGPVTPWDKVPSLVDSTGRFYNFDDLHAHLPQIILAELELEFRAQIETVLAAGLHPTHLDWHAIRFGPRTDMKDLLARLAKAYGLALRVIGRSWIQQLQGQGLPTIDDDFLDSYSIDPVTKFDRYTQLLRELPEGLGEWAVHPGWDTPELLDLEPTGNHIRQMDYDFWISDTAKQVVKEEGIVLLDYRGLQALWQGR